MKQLSRLEAWMEKNDSKRRVLTRRQLLTFVSIMLALQLVTLLEIVILPLRVTGFEAFFVLGLLAMLWVEVYDGRLVGAMPKDAIELDDKESKLKGLGYSEAQVKQLMAVFDKSDSPTIFAGYTGSIKLNPVEK